MNLNNISSPKKEFDGIFSNEEYNSDLKERLEKEHNSKLIKYNDLVNIAPEFSKWLNYIVGGNGNVDSKVLIFNYPSDNNRFKCYFYSNDYVYTISGCKANKNNIGGYLGCIVSTRKSRPGENWHRGHDLPDGPYSKETFDLIIHKIIANELKDLQLWR